MNKSIYTQEQFDKILKERNELANENFKLKQQLVEWEKDSNATLNEYRAIKCENKQLKQQLAEKDAEIEQWKSMAERSSSMLDRFNYCGESIIYNTTREQDKISFAVDKLQIIRKDIDCYMAIREGDLTDSAEAVLIYFADKIEKLIKQLTHQHEDKGE